jgi:hypothetical protein
MVTASPGGPARSRDSGGVAAASRLQGVSKRYDRRDGVDALHEVSVSFPRGNLLTDRGGRRLGLPEALSRVAESGSALAPEVVAQLLAWSRSPLGSLTARMRGAGAHRRGRSNSMIAAALVAGAAAERRLSNIFTMLGLAPEDTDYRRVLAVPIPGNGVTLCA